MKKYLRAVICLIFSLIKLCLIKLFHPKRVMFTSLNIISPFTTIEIEKKAKLTLARMVRIRSGCKIRVRQGGDVRIGYNTSLNHNCMIISHDKIHIGNDVQFGPNVLVYDHDHDYKQKDGLKNLLYKTSPVLIGDNVWIGANVVILRGTIIGSNCVVGAGAIVKGVYPDNTTIIQKRETTIFSNTEVKR